MENAFKWNKLQQETSQEFRRMAFADITCHKVVLQSLINVTRNGKEWPIKLGEPIQ